MPTYKADHRIEMPTPPHAQTAGAREAVEAMIAQGHARRLDRAFASIVTDHGRPRVEPYDADPVTASARRLLAAADAAGWRTNLVELADRCSVEAVRGTTAFRAVWVRGKIDSARWFERDYRYEYIDDPRPEPKVNEKLRVSLANRRPVGCSKIHLKLVAGPCGVPIPIAELTKRVKKS